VTSGRAIRQAFCQAVLEQVEGIAHALPNEPVSLPKFDGGAIVTMMLRRAPARIVSTGPIAEVRWQWSVYLYIPMRDYEEAQEQLEELLPQLMLVTLVNADLDETCDQADLTDDGEEPFAEEDGNTATLVKRLLLTAVGEIGA
jgi:hypothetical protein